MPQANQKTHPSQSPSFKTFAKTTEFVPFAVFDYHEDSPWLRTADREAMMFIA
ncbi:MAG: hypothetical protein KAR22_25210 [Gammaproteobacteria bacterium]|nr:hypothetical protein [Gammaproteobacteria bacterium]